MTEVEAVQRGNAFVLKNTGVAGEPEHVQLVTRLGQQRYWSLIYGAALFFPEAIAAGDTIDGGEYMVRVNDQSGEVSRFAFLG